MPPSRKFTKACKAMKDLDIPEDKVKPALKELLELYENKWDLIEDEDYRVLLDFILEKKHEEDKREECKQKVACSNQKAKSNKEKAELHDEPEVVELPKKRLRSWYQKEHTSAVTKPKSQSVKAPVKRRAHQDEVELSSGSQTSSESEDSEPLVKRFCPRQREELALVPVDNSNLQLVRTPFKRERQDETELSSGSQNCSEPEDSELLVKRSSLRRGQWNSSVAGLSQTCCNEEVDESSQLIVGDEQAKPKHVSPLQHIRNGGKEPYSPGTCAMPEAEKTSVNDIRHFEKLKVEPHMELTPIENVLDMYHNNSLDLPRGKSFTDDQLQDEVPLAVILPDGSSNGNGSIVKADGLEFMEPKSLDMGDKAPLHVSCEDGFSNGKNSDVKEDNLEILELDSMNVEDKCDSVVEVLQFDVASSSKGEVKLSLICNSSQQSDFQIPSLDAVLKMMEEKCLKSYGITEPNFSLSKLMTEFCECFWAMGTDSAVDKHLRSGSVSPTKISEAQEVHDGKDGYGGNCCIPPNLSSGSVVFQNIEVVTQIPKPVALSGLGGLHCVSDFKNKDIEIICDKSESRLKVLKDPQSSNSSNVEVVQNQPTSLPIIKSCDYVDDITRGEEKVKISLLNGSGAEDIPIFKYIPQNLVYNKAYVNFALARVSDEDCCSHCFEDCLSSPIPCACARETGGEFAYMPGGLVKEKFLDEIISVNQDPKEHHYFYCKKCPLERSKNKKKPGKCKGHLLRKFIKECWYKCGCSKKCGNRVIQRGISANLQVFWTPEGKGWGLRTLEELPRGAFVCEYVGEIVTNSELDERNLQSTGNQKHTYPVLLDADWGSEGVLKDEEALCLDATVYGNVARFINHRCSDATLAEIPVEMETPDRHYYHLAFFTTRKVAAMEELTWDYGIDFDDHDHPVKSFQCLCGSPSCRSLNC